MTRWPSAGGVLRAVARRDRRFRGARVQEHGRRVVRGPLVGVGGGVVCGADAAAVRAACRSAEQALQVRIGLGTGESTVRDGAYFGMPSIEAARCATRRRLTGSWCRRDEDAGEQGRGHPVRVGGSPARRATTPLMRCTASWATTAATRRTCAPEPVRNWPVTVSRSSPATPARRRCSTAPSAWHGARPWRCRGRSSSPLTSDRRLPARGQACCRHACSPRA